MLKKYHVEEKKSKNDALVFYEKDNLAIIMDHVSTTFVHHVELRQVLVGLVGLVGI